MKLTLLVALALGTLAASLSGCRVLDSEPVRVRTITVNGAQIEYAEQGRGETVVFLHGAGTDRRIWDQIRPYIASRHRFVAYSRRHHHPNPWPDDGSSHHVSQHADDLAEFVRLLGVDRVHIVAVSLGGQVAARMMARHPERVAKAVLSDTLLAWPTTDESKPVLEAFMRRFASLRSAVGSRQEKEAAKALVDWVSDASNGWHELPPSRRDLYLDNAATLLLMVHESSPPLRCHELSRLTPPVLVLAGAETPAAFQLTNKHSVSCLPPTTEYVEVPEAAHFWYTTHPQAAAARILTFFAQHSGATGARR